MEKGFQIIKDFIEGKIDVEKIIELCKNDEEFRSFTKDFKNNSLRKYDDSFLYFVDNANLYNPTSQLILYLVFTRELLVNKIEFRDTDLYIKNAQKYAEIIPDWLPDSAQDWVEEDGDQVTYIFENEKTKEQISLVEYY